jgi:hypothetical protein
MNGFYRSSGRSAKPLIARLKQQAAVLSLCVRAAEKISWRQVALLLRKLQQILRQLFLLRRMVALGLPLVALTSVLVPAKSWGFYAPLNAEFRVATTTTGAQIASSVGMDSDGDYVIAWCSPGPDEQGAGIYAQRYSAAGIPLTPAFHVNTYTTGNQTNPSVATDSNGNFVVIWQSTAQDGDGEGVYGQRYDAAGVPQGGEFHVNTYTTSNQAAPRVAMDIDGDFVVVWKSLGQDTSGEGVYGQRYNAAGVPQGDEMRLGAPVAGDQTVPTVGIAADGTWVVVWQSSNHDGSGAGIHARRYNPSGGSFGVTLQINTYTTGNQTNPSVAVDADGDFVVTWQSANQDGSGEGIYARRFNSSFTAQGAEFRVNTYTTGAQRNPRVAVDTDGDFVIAWQSANQDGSGYGIYTQRYTNAGVADGGEFTANTYTTNAQLSPSLGMSSTGDFVLAWQSIGQDGDTEGIYAQRYSASFAEGGEIQVNSHTTGDQTRSHIAVDADGDYVVVWHGVGPDGFAIYGRKFKIEGGAAGSPFRINTYTTDSKGNAHVAMDAAGNFVVVWESAFQDGSDSGVYGQRFDANLTPQGGEFRVNTFTTRNQGNAQVAMDADGDFVVTWESYSQDGALSGVYAQRYNAAGIPQGGEFRVNTYTTGNQSHPDIAMDANGDFVVTWYGENVGDSDGVYARRYDAAGAAQGPEFQVNTHTTSSQSSPSVAMDQDGDFVVAWIGNQDDGDNGIYARRFDAAGASQGAEFRVNTYTTGAQLFPHVAMDADGGFIITWQSVQDPVPSGVEGIYAQIYKPDGVPYGTEFRVNTFTTGVQEYPQVGVDAVGNFAITWTSKAQDGDVDGVYVQPYAWIVAAPEEPDLVVTSDTGEFNFDDQTTDSTPTFTGTVPDGYDIYLYDGETLIGSHTGGGFYSITVAPLSPGLHQIRAVVVDTNGNQSVFSDSLGIVIASDRQDLWKYEKFGGNAGNPTISGDAADPDGDGIVNLMEYGLGLDPNVSSLVGFPVVWLEESTGRLRIQFNRLSDRSGMGYVVQVSDDMETWIPIAWAAAEAEATSVVEGRSVIVSETGTTIKTVVVEDNMSPATPGKRFLRIYVSTIASGM